MVAQYYTPTPSSFSGSQGRQTSIPNAVPPSFDLKQSVAALTESVSLLHKQHIALRRVLRSYDHVSPEALSEWSALIKRWNGDLVRSRQHAASLIVIVSQYQHLLQIVALQPEQYPAMVQELRTLIQYHNKTRDSYMTPTDHHVIDIVTEMQRFLRDTLLEPMGTSSNDKDNRMASLEAEIEEMQERVSSLKKNTQRNVACMIGSIAAAAAAAALAALVGPGLEIALTAAVTGANAGVQGVKNHRERRRLKIKLRSSTAQREQLQQEANFTALIAQVGDTLHLSAEVAIKVDAYESIWQALHSDMEALEFELSRPSAVRMNAVLTHHIMAAKRTYTCLAALLDLYAKDIIT